jgi:hypothetical protein
MGSLKTLKTFCGLAAVVLILCGCGGGAGSSSASASGTSGPPGATAPTSKGSATLAWTAPTSNSDGSALTNLAGYHIYYGSSAGSLSNMVNVTSASTLTYVVGNLGTGTWYFAVAAYTNTGAESGMSNVGSKMIS